jgi:hypothetical protein
MAKRTKKTETAAKSTEAAENYTTSMNPTYAFRFVVLATALKRLSLSGESVVPQMSPVELLKVGCKVTGLRAHKLLRAGTADAAKLSEAVRWLADEIKKGVMVCPQCHKATVIPLVPECREQQTDGTTHVCHFYAGGCDMGYNLPEEV